MGCYILACSESFYSVIHWQRFIVVSYQQQFYPELFLNKQLWAPIDPQTAMSQNVSFKDSFLHLSVVGAAASDVTLLFTFFPRFSQCCVVPSFLLRYNINITELQSEYQHFKNTCFHNFPDWTHYMHVQNKYIACDGTQKVISASFLDSINPVHCSHFNTGAQIKWQTLWMVHQLMYRGSSLRQT